MAKKKDVSGDDSLNIRFYANTTHDHLTAGETAAGIQTAKRGAEYIKKITAAKGRANAVKATEEAGADYSTAEAIVSAASSNRMPPSRLVVAMLRETVEEREDHIRDAVCSFETGNWVDGKNEQGESVVADVMTKELVGKASEEKNPFKCFLMGIWIATRSVKTEYVGKMALYVMSETFQQDLSVYASGEKESQDFKRVSGMFNYLEKIRGGKVPSQKDSERFLRTLDERIETALDLKSGDARNIVSRGPDGTTYLPPEDGISTLGVVYATANDTEGKSVSNAMAIDRHWDSITEKADRLRLFFVARPIIPCDASRLYSNNAPLAKVGSAISKLQVAETLLLASKDSVMKGVLDGSTTVEGLFFSSGKPFVFGKDVFSDIKGAFEEIGKFGYPPATDRGREAWMVFTKTLFAWSRNHPETFPWFKDRKLKSFLKNCPADVAKTPVTDPFTFMALSAVDTKREDALEEKQETAEKKKRIQEIEEIPTSLPMFVDMLAEQGRNYAEGRADEDALRALINKGDERKIKEVLAGGIPRKVMWGKGR